MDDSSVDLRVLRRDAQFPEVINMIMAGNSREEIADTLGVSEKTISNWIRTPEFISLWQETLLTSTNVWKEAAARAIADMLPEAVAQHKDLLTNELTSDSVRWRVIQKTYQMSGLEERISDSHQQLREFLRGNRITITNINHALIVDGAVDPSFLEALGAALPPMAEDDGDEEVVEGEFRETED